jgi:hypothetical protein
MSAKRKRPDNLFAGGPFWVGMGFIFSAPILNLAYDRLHNARKHGDGSEVMPEFLATIYNLVGPTGVTLVLVTVGVAVLTFAFLRQRSRNRSVKVSSAAGSWAPRATRDSSADEPEQAPTGAGQMSLQTRKYLQ